MEGIEGGTASESRPCSQRHNYIKGWLMWYAPLCVRGQGYTCAAHLSAAPDRGSRNRAGRHIPCLPAKPLKLRLGRVQINYLTNFCIPKLKAVLKKRSCSLHWNYIYNRPIHWAYLVTIVRKLMRLERFLSHAPSQATLPPHLWWHIQHHKSSEKMLVIRLEWYSHKKKCE